MPLRPVPLQVQPVPERLAQKVRMAMPKRLETLPTQVQPVILALPALELQPLARPLGPQPLELRLGMRRGAF